MERTRNFSLPLIGALVMTGLALVAGSTVAATRRGQEESRSTVPGLSFKEMLGLRSVGASTISPDGSMIAYQVSSTDWESNSYQTEIWLARRGEAPFQLTRAPEGSSSGPRWSPDGRWLAFFRGEGDSRQVYLIRPDGGEARPLAKMEQRVNRYRWSPDGRRIAFTASEPVSETTKARRKAYGEFAVEDAEYRTTHLWLLELETEDNRESRYFTDASPRRLTGGDDFTVGSFSWSPDGTEIAFDHRPDPLINSSVDTDISVLDVATGDIRHLVQQPSPDRGPIWSPDGGRILFSTSMGKEAFYYLNDELATVPASGGEIRQLTGDFDEDPSNVHWNAAGITFVASIRTSRQLFSLDPESGETTLLADTPRVIQSVDFSADGRTLAIQASGPSHLTEIFRTRLDPYSPVQVTDMTEQVAGWPLGSREVVQWKSEDGTRIEGVLYKPADYDPGHRYPLLVVIHGGPTGTSRPQLVPRYVYPVLQWLAKGAVVMMPNYRGSAGYGETFRSLNVRNLGVGDSWDVLSGVQYLIDEGIADSDRLGAMGWSQGGYISAFLTTTSDRFKAISVGAGISDWMTYYVNTDIHPFTRQYLKANPWDDPEIYAKTSPMTYIQKARTPTLIQHGELDRRVPIANSYELYQGLQDEGVETKLIVYKGFGHPINKPKERLAATWHNWIWFARYIWDEEVELPLEIADASEHEQP
ncbi:MAG: prolyl oligopeptidase family serine peptidase [Acidobacteriota bacterium]